jgi:isopropylmalate/isohomocitrate dehydrogenase-like protein
MKYKIGVIYGDGVGPEVISSALNLLNDIGFDAEYIKINAGFNFYKISGKPIEDSALEKLKECHAILKGPISTLPESSYPSITVMLRKYFNLYINFRPFMNIINDKFPYFNFIIFRENTEGLYSGAEWRSEDLAITLQITSRKATEKIVKYALNYAIKNNRRRVTVVHKATVIKETDGFFREIFFKEAQKYSRINADEILVDSAAYQLVKNPEQFDILITPNLYGDILSDLAAGLVGSLGLCGSANIGDEYALFEPVHGTATDIAGKGIANPVGSILAASYMLNWLSEKNNDGKLKILGNAIEKAITDTLKSRYFTKELGGLLTTTELTKIIITNTRKYLD